MPDKFLRCLIVRFLLKRKVIEESYFTFLITSIILHFFAKYVKIAGKKMQMQDKSLEYCIATKYPIMFKITSK